MGKCEYLEKDGFRCSLNECMYGDFLFFDDSAFETGRYCYATCEEYKKAKALKEHSKKVCGICLTDTVYPNTEEGRTLAVEDWENAGRGFID